MNISEHLKKPYWRRRWVVDKTPPPPTDTAHYIAPIHNFEGNYRYLTNADFANEISTSAHDINSLYMSTRPIKEAREVLDANGCPILDTDGNPKKEWVTVDYDDLETTRYGLQRRIQLCKAAHFAGDGWGIYNEQTDKSQKAHERFDNLCSWRDIAALDAAEMEVVRTCFGYGDCALYIYQDGNTITYDVFGYDKGDNVFMDYNENHFPVVYRLYTLRGVCAVDVFGEEYIETWVQADISDEDKQQDANNWFSKIRGWFKNHDFAISEDGWQRISRRKTQISGVNACVYFRIDDIPSGAAQEDISALERSASYLAESVKSTAFSTLFIKATDIKSLPSVGSFGATIAVQGNVEELKAADAKQLPPSNISDVVTIDLKEKKESILHSTLSVIVDPDILRSGADSSSAMRLCFNDEVKWCMTMQPQFLKPLKQVVEVLKSLVAKIEQDPEYTKIRCSVGMNIWVPSNFSEQVENICKLKYAGILSAENCRHELDINYPDDINIVDKEAERDLYRKAFVPIKAKYEAEKLYGFSSTNETDDNNADTPTDEDNPNDYLEKQSNNNAFSPKIDNNATNK